MRPITRLDFKTNVTCPQDGKTIELAVTVDAGSDILLVEELLEAVASVCKTLCKTPLLQEEFTQALSRRLEMPVTTVGTHSGVTITCSC